MEIHIFMIKFFFNASLLMIILIFPSCETESILSDDQNISPNDFYISHYGSTHSFDIATWNIEHFPKNQVHTIPQLINIIQKIDIDLIALQEIDENIAFYNMIDSLNNYHGYISQLPKNGQRLAIIYKSDMISISDPEQIFSDDDWAFPRPPLVSFVTVKKENKIMLDFILIVIHLKAFVDAVANDKEPPVVGDDGLQPVLIGMAALKSLSGKKPVRVEAVGI